MKKRIGLGFLFCLFFSLCGCGGKEKQAISLENIVRESDTKISCTFDGIERYFIFDLPEKTEGEPLVLMLHGYGGSPEGFRATVHFEEQAKAMGYGVVYVAGATNPGDATSSNGWHSGISSTGNRDVEFLVSLAEYLQEEYTFDKERTYAGGFSNGAFMTHRLAMEAGDTFSAVVSVAGMMPARVWETRNRGNNVSVLQISGEKDAVVPKHSDGSAKTAINPAIEDVMEYWANSNGLEFSETYEVGKQSVLKKYGDRKRKEQVWHLFVKGGYHSWPDEESDGFDTNALILDFFEELK